MFSLIIPFAKKSNNLLLLYIFHIDKVTCGIRDSSDKTDEGTVAPREQVVFNAHPINHINKYMNSKS